MRTYGVKCKVSDHGTTGIWTSNIPNLFTVTNKKLIIKTLIVGGTNKSLDPYEKKKKKTC